MNKKKGNQAYAQFTKEILKGPGILKNNSIRKLFHQKSVSKIQTTPSILKNKEKSLKFSENFPENKRDSESSAYPNPIYDCIQHHICQFISSLS